MTKIERIQKEYEERLARQRKNRQNWSGAVFSPKRERSIADAEDFLFEGQRWKPMRGNI